MNELEKYLGLPSNISLKNFFFTVIKEIIMFHNRQQSNALIMKRR